MSGPPPPVPKLTLRAHSSPIHTLRFCRNNTRLISGDESGVVVMWRLPEFRPHVVWKAHPGNAILGVCVWDDEGGNEDTGAFRRVVTHGRDHRLKVWKLGPAEEQDIVNGAQSDSIVGSPQALSWDAATALNAQAQPWLLHSLPVNALNFCAFTFLPSYDACSLLPPSTALFAVPNALHAGAVDIFHLPSEKRLCTIPADKDANTGMTMAVSMFVRQRGESTNRGYLYLIAGFEDGSSTVHCADLESKGPPKDINDISTTSIGSWKTISRSKPHSQPVLSLAVAPSHEFYITSSADSIIAKFPIPSSQPASTTTITPTIRQTKHAGQQGLQVRSDGKIFATAGWDARARVYSTSGKGDAALRELAVLKFHSQGCFATAFADILDDGGHEIQNDSSSREQGSEEAVGQVVVKHASGSRSLEAIKRQRAEKVTRTHWLAVGGKDCKVSVWEIY